MTLNAELKLFIFCPNCYSPYFRRSEKPNVYRECDSCGYIITFTSGNTDSAEQKSDTVDELK